MELSQHIRDLKKLKETPTRPIIGPCFAKCSLPTAILELQPVPRRKKTLHNVTITDTLTLLISKCRELVILQLYRLIYIDHLFCSCFKAGFHMIADDRGSQIAESSAIVCDHMETHFCDRLRSSAIVCDPAIIWKPKFCDLRSKCIP